MCWDISLLAPTKVEALGVLTKLVLVVVVLELFNSTENYPTEFNEIWHESSIG